MLRLLMPPSSGPKNNNNKKDSRQKELTLLVSRFAYYSTVGMDTEISSETLDNF
jgi:hypothetical protein